MSNQQFKSNFKRRLSKYLSQSGEYKWSSRIEGMLERSDQLSAPPKAEILIDGEIEKSFLIEMTTDIIDVLNHSDFRRTKFMVHLWIDNKFEKKKHGNIEFIPIKLLKEVLDDLDFEAIQSGDADNFNELYSVIKKAPLVIFITTEKKRELLLQEDFRYKNILFVDAIQ